MHRAVAVVSVTAVVVLAGCAGPLGMDSSTRTASPTPTQVATETPTSSPSSGQSGSLPPGVGSTGLDNATQLMAAHVEALNRTGFVGVGAGNGTVLREGFLIDVESRQRNEMTSNASTYRRNRTVLAGPVEREWEAWGNRTVEIRRTKENGEWSLSEESPAAVDQLAGRGLLLPYLQGGNFTLGDPVESDNESRHRLVATEIEDPEALMEALPDDVDQITSFEATVIVDSEGRIHSIEAQADYEIRGETATHHLTYSLEQVGEVSIDRPTWVDER